MEFGESAWLLHLDGGRVRYYSAKGYRTRSVEAGDDGDVVILMHGMGGHAETWLRNLLPLAKAGHRIYSIDLLGHGMSDKPELTYTIDVWVDQVLGFADALEAEQFHVGGISLGGWVAMRTALARPERVLSVLNITGGGLRPVPPTPEEEAGWATLDVRTSDLLDQFGWDSMRARMNWLVHDPASMPDEMVEIRRRFYVDPEAQRAARSIHAEVAKMLRQQKPGAISADELRSFPSRVLYAWTDHNPTTPVSVARAAHEITPSSELVMFEDCAHWPHYEKPEEFTARALAFLAR
jgi:2-hydroxy-6-oxonona-2,4-dienedioate hydrolase